MHPSSYGEEVHELCGRTDPPRDAVELLFARWALEEGKPLLGVCRGMQVINVAAGGTLYQDCEAHFPGRSSTTTSPRPATSVTFSRTPSRWSPEHGFMRIYGTARALVNSMHHQGVNRLGEGLIPSAHSPDGLLEALEDGRDHRFAVGVQWHPEMLIDRDGPTRLLFAEFVRAAAAFRSNAALTGAG
jgi:putative glutamine amidotransferase